MRKDVGVDGEAQRISQLVWLLFLKIFDAQEEELECTRGMGAAGLSILRVNRMIKKIKPGRTKSALSPTPSGPFCFKISQRQRMA